MEHSPNAAPPATPKAQNEDSLAGFAFAGSAYLLWGMLPLYMKALSAVSPVEVVAHRIVWALPVALLVLVWLGRTGDLKRALKTPRMMAMASLTALIVSANWGVYVWAIASGHALDAALGYYINPLFSVLLGAVLLGERLKGIQWLAILAALIGVAILTYDAGRLPVVALLLTLTWGFYAYFKKSLPIGPNQGFALEVIILMPAAIVTLIWLAAKGEMLFLHGPTWQTVMLFLCGLVTAGPLMLYANGAKRMRLTTIAMMQYVSPTMIFLTAVFIFNEPFSQTKLLAFGFIWASLAIYSLSLIRRH